MPILFAVAIAAAYGNSLHGGFHFDDGHALEQNPFIRSLRHVPRYFVDPDTTTVLHENKDLRPLLLVTFALNYAISGYDTWSWHALNLVLHWLVVMLVFRIVRDHFWLDDEARVPVAVAAALVVAVHPLGTETLDYLSARSALLTTLFYLAAFDAAVRARTAPACLCFALALLTKAIAITLPFTIVAYWVMARARSTPPRPWPRALFAGLAVVAAAGVGYRALLLPPWVYTSAHQVDATTSSYVMTGWSAYLYYLRLFLWPDALVVDRTDYHFVRSLWEPQAWASLLALVALAALAWSVRRRWPAVTMAALWYGITLAAEQTVFPLAEAVNEHRPYLALLGPATIAAVAAWALVTALTAPRARLRTFVAVVTLAVCSLGAVTIARNRLWNDDEALWVDATRKAPANSRAWLNAGHAAMRRDARDVARTRLLEAHRLAPCYAYIQMNLSALAARQGQLDESLRWADDGVRCNTGFALTHFYRGAALERLKRIDDALAEYRITTSLDPQHTDAWIGQGRLLEQRARWAEAADAYEHARTTDPTRAEASMLAGLVYHYHLGQPALAVERYRDVLLRNPTHYGAHYQLAVALLAAGRLDDARAAWQAFVPEAEKINDQKSLAGAPAALRAP